MSDEIPNWLPKLIKATPPWPVIKFKLEFYGFVIEAHRPDGSYELVTIGWESVTHDHLTKTIYDLQTELYRIASLEGVS